MKEQTITVYFSSDTDGYGRVRVWTVFIGSDGALCEYAGHAWVGALNDGFGFTRCVVHTGPEGKITGNNMITEKRLFNGFRIHPRPCVLNMETLHARSDPEASLLTGMEGETLPTDPALNPKARALGSPVWFF